MIRKNLIWMLSVFLLLPGVPRAEAVAPDALVKNVTEEVLTILRQDKGIQSGNTQRAVTLIENKVAPHFDFDRMTSLAVGRAWKQADAGQRKVLTGEFHKLLVRTYANSLTTYRDQTVSFKSPTKASGSDDVIVRSQINQPGGQPIPLDYSLAKADDGWKVFDVAVANISLVTNYRNNFASEIEKGGVAGLIKVLQEKNRRGDSSPQPAG